LIVVSSVIYLIKLSGLNYSMANGLITDSKTYDND